MKETTRPGREKKIGDLENQETGKLNLYLNVEKKGSTVRKPEPDLDMVTKRTGRLNVSRLVPRRVEGMSVFNWRVLFREINIDEVSKTKGLLESDCVVSGIPQSKIDHLQPFVFV